MTGFAKGIADDDDDEFKKSGHMSDAARATFSNLVYRTLKYSSNDFMWANAIFDISMDWNPMALSYLGNELNTLGNFITGDEEFSDVMVKSFTAAR
jgi:hypothetical protein